MIFPNYIHDSIKDRSLILGLPLNASWKMIIGIENLIILKIDNGKVRKMAAKSVSPDVHLL